MKSAIALTVASAALLATASPSYAAEKVIKKFNEATIDTVLAAVGATVIEKGSDGTNPAVLFTVDGLKYTAFLKVCRPETGCLGIALQCSFDGDTFATSAVNSFNLAHIFSTLAVSEDRKSLHLARYMIADGGTTVENVTENFKVFFSMPAQLVAHLKQQSSAPVASATPLATPAASGSSTPTVVAGAAPGAPAEVGSSGHTATEQSFSEKAANKLAP